MINSNILQFSAPISEWKNAEKTITQKDNLGDEIIRFIRIRAKDTNTGYIHIGSYNLTEENSTIKLSGGQYIELAIDNLSKIYVIATVSGDAISYNYVP